jgi:hypothetical protein
MPPLSVFPLQAMATAILAAAAVVSLRFVTATAWPTLWTQESVTEKYFAMAYHRYAKPEAPPVSKTAVTPEPALT